MSNDAKDGNHSPSFLEYLEQKGYRFDYKTYDFLYDHDGPCPQVARDHPFGQAPEVLNIPQGEWDDWSKYVAGYYYSQNTEFALKVAEFGFEFFFKGFKGFTPEFGSGYDEVTDDEFALLLGEGLYSKFLCPLAPYPQDQKDRWGTLDPNREYFLSDYSCMRVITHPWEDEYVAPTVVLLSRPKGDYTTRESYGTDPTKTVYRVDAIDLSFWEKDVGIGRWAELDKPLTPTDKGWSLAKYFVLQGAIHRINLIDHTKVHFPSDAINAITKTALPKRNLVFQLLMPHFWLQLPVNNTVLEADRSLISRNSWYPWSPFVASGLEIRKLLPFGWYGSNYYEEEDKYFKTSNPSYPAYRFALTPADIPSRYGLFFADYFTAITNFVGKVVEQIPPDNPNHTDWVEIQDWATQIALWIPGFPDWNDLPDSPPGRETLTNALAMIILNNAVMHTADHGTLHQMMNDKPVPFILRIKPPESSGDSLPADQTLQTFLDKLKKEGKISEELYNEITNSKYWSLLKKTPFLPLCLPTDRVSARMTDLLFYLPHNSSLLIDCDYQFTNEGQATLKAKIEKLEKEKDELEEHWFELKSAGYIRDPAEKILVEKIDALQRQLLPSTDVFDKAVKEFQDDLRPIDRKYSEEIAELGFPMVEPPSGLTDKGEIKKYKRTMCMGAGIQY